MQRRPLSVELLEDRCVPATWGNPWPDPQHLTLSFAPDGTVVGNNVSDLQATLDAQASPVVWEDAILRAFQTWAVNANINIGVVADGGQALGTPGAPQGDSRFGDIRIAGYEQPQSNNELALSSPFDVMSGTWSGDVRFNTSAGLGINGTGAVDLFSVALHEAGHVFGFADNSDPTSVMDAVYQGTRTGLSAGDISMLQALYGAPPPDTAGNTLATATPLNLLKNPDGTLGIAVNGDIGSLTDADVYRFQAPLTAGPLTIQLQTAGMSLLTAKMTVYNSAGNAIASTSTTDPLNNNLSVTINSPQLLGTYYVKIESGTQDVFGMGSYHLQIQSLPVVKQLTGTLTGILASATSSLNALPTNTTFLTATLLPPLTTQVNSSFAYSYRGSISGSSDVNYYRITAQGTAGTQTVMTAMVWGIGNRSLSPSLSVYDAQQHLVQAEVLVNQDGTFVVQVQNATAGASYYIEVAAANPNGPSNAGNYFLGVDFTTNPVQLNTIAENTLNAATPAVQGVLTVAQGEMLHLVLGATGGQANVQMTIANSQGQVIAAVTVASGANPVSLTNIFGAGQYVVSFWATTPSGSPIPDVQFDLQGIRLDDPQSPSPSNSTAAPSGSPPPSSSSSTTSSSTTSTSPPPPSTSPPPSSSTSTSGSPGPTSSTAPPPNNSTSTSPPPSSSTSTSSQTTSSGSQSSSSSAEDEYSSQYSYEWQSGSSSPPSSSSSPPKTS